VGLAHDGAILTIILAFVGYLVTFMITRMLARRRDKLEMVTRRLNEFYGPLYVASQAGNIATARCLRNKARRRASHPRQRNEGVDAVDDHIFMPLNDIREKIIIEKAYLVVEEQMPHCCWILSPTWWVTRRCWPSGRRATTPSGVPPSAGLRSLTSTSSARMPP